MKNVELYIKGKQAVLPKNLSLQIIECNPLIERKGDYTFDFDLSLENRDNAIIFGFINRLNKIDFPSRLDATLHYNFKQYTGSVLVISNTEKSVKLQFVGNNSYINSAEIMQKKVWELDWGKVDELDFWNAVSDSDLYGFHYWMDGFYEKNPIYGHNTGRHWIIPEILMNVEDFTVIREQNGGGSIPSKVTVNEREVYILNEFRINVENYYRTVIQPFLMYYIDKLPDILGFELTESVLNNNDLAKRIYIANRVFSMEYAKKLPDWTLSEFITEIENFFNISFVFDSNKRKMKIINTTKQLTDFKNNSLDVNNLVIKQYEREFPKEDKESENRIEAKNIAYQQQDNHIFYKHHMFQSELLNELEIKDFENEQDLINFVVNLTENEYDKELNNQRVLLLNKSTNDYYFCIKHTYEDDIEGSQNILNTLQNLFYLDLGNIIDIQKRKRAVILINKLNPKNNEYDTALKLKIIPVPVEFVQVINYISYQNYRNDFYQLPFPNNNFKLTNQKTFTQNLYDGINNEKPDAEYLEIALYGGLMVNFSIPQTPFSQYTNKSLTYINNTTEFGFLVNKYLHQYTVDLTNKFNEWYTTIYKPATNNFSLRIVDLQKKYYSKSLTNTEIYHFTLKDDIKLTTEKTFFYNGSYYIPISLERNTNSNLVEGKFYKIT